MPNPVKSAKPPSPVQIRAAPPFFRAKSTVSDPSDANARPSNWTTVDYKSAGWRHGSGPKPLIQPGLLVATPEQAGCSEDLHLSAVHSPPEPVVVRRRSGEDGRSGRAVYDHSRWPWRSVRSAETTVRLPRPELCSAQ